MPSMDLASSLSVIGWFVQVLFDKGITFAINHWRGAGAAPDLLEALERLRETFNNVRSLLHIARKIRSEDEGLLESVKDLKDAAYDAEDIISELDYYRLQEVVEGNDNSNNTSFFSSMKEAAGGFFSRLPLTNEDTQASTSSPPPSVFDNTDTIIPRINKVVDRLDRIFACVSRVLPLLNPEERDADSHGPTSHRVATSFVSSKQTMFGRDDTKAHIINLAQSVSADESFLIDTNNQEVPSRVRHLSLSSDHITVLQKSYLRNLRTLIIMMSEGREPTNYDVLEELLNELKSVRVLYIQRLDFEQWLHNIGHLIHLRYLHLPNFGERKVTDSLCRLYHLQYAEVAQKSLYLHRIEKLTCLQELDCFIIEKGRKIGELKNLKQLGGSLTLESLENVNTKEEALEAELSKKMHIRNLRLKWNDSLTIPEVAEEPAYIKKAEEVFEGIRPPAYIKMLFIDVYGGLNTPTWMVCFSNLESLFLLNCSKWKDLPPLGELPSLRHLTICKADAVEVIGREFYGTGNARGFSCLETLEFICMPQLVTWSGIGEDSDFLFPRLDKLLIADCPKLEQVPVKDLTSLKKVTLSSCNWLHLLPLLPAMLEVLVLHNLGLLTDLTMEKLSDLTSLRKLYIKRCPCLNSLPLLPASLKILEVNECPKLSRERYLEGGEDWNNVSHIPEIEWYQEDTRTQTRTLTRARARELAWSWARARARDLARSWARAPVPVLALSLALARERARVRASAPVLEQELARARARDLARELARELEREWVLELEREWEWQWEWELEWERELARVRLLV